MKNQYSLPKILTKKDVLEKVTKQIENDFNANIVAQVEYQGIRTFLLRLQTKTIIIYQDKNTQQLHIAKTEQFKELGKTLSENDKIIYEKIIGSYFPQPQINKPKI